MVVKLPIFEGPENTLYILKLEWNILLILNFFQSFESFIQNKSDFVFDIFNEMFDTLNDELETLDIDKTWHISPSNIH